MNACRRIKNALIHFYSHYDMYLTAAVKFLTAFTALLFLSLSMGYLTVLNQIPVIFIVAAFCSFLPGTALILAGAVFLEGHFYAYSLEAAICGGLLLLVLLLFYFCFLPGQSYVVVLTALALALHVPCALPVACGLLLGPGACGGLLMGTGVYFTASSLCAGAGADGEMGEAMLNQILLDFQKTLLNPELITLLVALSASFFVVYLIRRLPMNYSWYVGIFSGIVTYLLLSVMGLLLDQIPVSPGKLILDAALGLAVGLILRFFCFSLDYARTEHLQFEDDDYYYYVKAVPKIGLDRTDHVTVKETRDDE